MKTTAVRYASFFLCLCLVVTAAAGCGKKSTVSKEEAYQIYNDLIQKFVPEFMTEPQECDVDITTRDEVTFVTEHFVRELNVKIQSQVVDGKLQYYLLSEFPAADKMDFYCINDDKLHAISCGLNQKGKLEEWRFSMREALLTGHLNIPAFSQEAIKDFKAEKIGSDIVMTFMLSGPEMPEGFAQRVMQEISPRQNEYLDDVTIVLTTDKNRNPKTMSTRISICILNEVGGIHAQKTLDMQFVFNKLDNVDFDLRQIISQYALETPAAE